ncbi:pre-mRNA-splicing factor CWC25 homolog [Galendromus occidentalis]|uniref:Pre-mRNA-splicing factor CWC25 homolog n=1 Tax=Galendromus occidentalis TaxID=34638 RepID=A0AAJ7WJA7_9ACAR|nr:pre-mRNA-splicing factor CWC25 homolog [Galendromus occidentalis]
MGGGNLNLKKSWHPSTLKNQERVWKAEQQEEMEKKKMEELHQELQHQREKEHYQDLNDEARGSTEKKNKMDWMYKGVTALVDREDYLLGRKVDKTFDVIQAAEEQNKQTAESSGGDGLPSQLFRRRNDDSDLTPVDMATKVREDPLYMIRKQEYESRKQLLSNPVRLKMLQEMIAKEKSGKSKKHKKSKKRKKKKDSDDDSDLDEGDIDAKIARSQNQRHGTRSPQRRQDSRSPSRRQRHSRSPEREKRTEDHTPRQRDDGFGLIRSSRARDREDCHEKKDYRTILEDRRKKEEEERKQLSIKLRERHSRKMTQEEKETKLREMQQDAAAHEKERVEYVKRHTKSDSIEVQGYKEGGFRGPEMLAKAVDSSTVEMRLKAKHQGLQRSSRAMESNFLRK